MLQSLLILIASPLGIAIAGQVAYSLVNGTVTLDTLKVSTVLTTAQDHVVYTLIDHLVFNNYIFYVISLALYPIWLMMWSVIWMNV